MRLLEQSGAVSIGVTVPDKLERWTRATTLRAHPRFEKLHNDPRRVSPGMTRLVLFAFSYQPYATIPEATPDAFYHAQTRARQAVQRVACALSENGYRAIAHPEIPLKAAFAQAGLARYGRNGLLSFGDSGTRVALSSVLTDAPIPCTVVENNENNRETGLDPACVGCMRCVRACPVHALSGDGDVSPDICLRGLPANVAVPEALRPMIGVSLLGCDLCQRACPRSAHVHCVDMPEDLRAACDLRRILSGDVKGLAPFLGDNYARKKRLQSRACLIAANLRRADLLTCIQALTQDDYPALRAHAQWAAQRLSL